MTNPAASQDDYAKLKQDLAHEQAELRVEINAGAPRTVIARISQRINEIHNAMLAIEAKQPAPAPAPSPVAPTLPAHVPTPEPAAPRRWAGYAQYETALYSSLYNQLSSLNADLQLARTTGAPHSTINAIRVNILSIKLKLGRLADRIAAINTGTLPAPAPDPAQLAYLIAPQQLAYVYATSRHNLDWLVQQSLAACPNTGYTVLADNIMLEPTGQTMTSEDADVTSRILPGRGVSYSNGLSIEIKGSPKHKTTLATLQGEMPTAAHRFLLAALIARSAYPENLRDTTFEINNATPQMIHWPGISHSRIASLAPVSLNTRAGWQPFGSLAASFQFPTAWTIYAFSVDIYEQCYNQGYAANQNILARNAPYFVRTPYESAESFWRFSITFRSEHRYVMDIDRVLVVNYGPPLYRPT